MAGKIIADTIEGTTTTETVGGASVTIPNSIDTKYVVNGSAKASWYYDQNNSTIRDSFNTSSIADTTEGRYNPTVASAFSNVYAVMSGATARTTIAKFSGGSGNTMTSTNTFECYTTDSNASNTPSDSESGGTGHGDLA